MNIAPVSDRFNRKESGTGPGSSSGYTIVAETLRDEAGFLVRRAARLWFGTRSIRAGEELVWAGYLRCLLVDTAAKSCIETQVPGSTMSFFVER